MISLKQTAVRSSSVDEDSVPADEDSVPADVVATAAVPVEVLPLPDLLSPTPSQPTAVLGQISNPYKMAEEAKLAVLTRHVNLTPAELPEKQRQTESHAFLGVESSVLG